MGPGLNATRAQEAQARALGRLAARAGWIVLTGGRAEGVMDAACRGAKEVGGLTVGVFGMKARKPSRYVDVPLLTGLSHGRNNINVLTSDVVVAVGGSTAGTVSEVALALKNLTPVILLGADPLTRRFLKRLGGRSLRCVDTPDRAFAAARRLLPRA